MKITRALGWILAFGLCQCSHLPRPELLRPIDVPPQGERIAAVAVPANQPWTATGVTVGAKDCLEIGAQGIIEIDRAYRGTDEIYDFEVAPTGTYSLSAKAFLHDFPMPTGNFGSIPAYSLIGRIGADGKPFYVGRKLRLNCGAKEQVKQAGELFLGVNDFDVSDNSGMFAAEIFRLDPKASVAVPEQVPPMPGARPVKPRIMTLYIDGLRPDVLYEMAANGFLPNIQKVFLERGVFYENAFTVFPSDTITSNGAWMTGVFSDRNGVKSQSEFDRQTGEIRTYLDKFTPTRAADLMRPVDEYRVLRNIKWFFTRVFGSREKAKIQRDELDQGTDAIYDYCEKNNIPFRATVLPILNPHPPKDWLSLFSNVVELPISAIEAVKSFDRTNNIYAYRYLLDGESQVISLWFPGVDVGSHFSARGQFGPALKYLYEADRHLGELVDKLKRRNLYDDTYFFLFSDHGHIGGRDYVNQRFNLPFELFYLPPRDDDHDGVIDEQSGLGFNVHKFDYEKTHSHEDDKDFIAFDIGSYGTAKVFLPFADRISRDWSKRNGYYQLTHYRVAPNLAPVDLLHRVLQKKPRNPNHYPGLVRDEPIAFVMLPVTGTIAPPVTGKTADPIDRIFVWGADGSQALIEHQSEGGRELYRYLPVRDFSQDENGEIRFREDHLSRDPLEYLSSKDASLRAFLRSWRTGREWLEKTARERFPNGPEFYFKYFHWAPMREKWKERKTPDFVFAANEGWTLRHEDVLSTDHGYAERESMNISLVVAGPDTRRGVISPHPVYSVDLIPTILHILGVPPPAEPLDGQTFPDLFAGETVDARFPQRAQSLERGAAHGNYTFAGVDVDLHLEKFSEEPPPEPLSTRFKMHDVGRYTDLHNLFADVFTVFNYELLYGFDRLADLVVPGPRRRPLESTTESFLASWDRLPNSWAKRRTGQFFAAIHLREFSLSDSYSVASLIYGPFIPVPVNLGFLQRYFDTVDWVQDMLMDFSGVVSMPFGKKDILGMRFVNGAIDVVEDPLIFLTRMATKYGFELADKGLLRLEGGIDFFANMGHDSHIVPLEEYPGHVGCTCNAFIVDMGREKSQSVQGGKGLNVPAPAQIF